MSILGIPAGMSMPVQPFAMSQPGFGASAYRPMLPQTAAANGAGLLGSPTGVTNRFVRAWKAAIAELRLGTQPAAPLTNTMPLARKPRTAAKRRRARAAKPVRVPSRTPGAIAAHRANQAVGMRPVMNPGVFPGMAGLAALPGMNRGMGMGYGMGLGNGMGSMGLSGSQPQLNASNQSGLAMGANGMDQHVTNDNVFDDRGFSVSEMPFGMDQMYGYGFGSPYASVLGWGNPMGFMPSSGYGASMTGAWYTQPHQSGIGGFFSRLFGR